MKKRPFAYALLSLLILLPAAAITVVCARPDNAPFAVSALPSSVRMDPSSGRIIDDAHTAYETEALGDLLAENWVYDGASVSLHAARGEYVSFQVVVENLTDSTLHDVIVETKTFSQGDKELSFEPELFLEWALEIKSFSTGYERGNLGVGWYPDALIPLDLLQMDVAKMSRLQYPLELPDFRNRIDNQRYMLLWIDQYIPPQAAAGDYISQITVRVGDHARTIPVKLHVWDFTLPEQNNLAANLQHEGFLKKMDEKLELEVYQLFKRHRVVPADPTYTPTIEVKSDGKVEIGWGAHDKRLQKYFSGEAFTEKYGYRGPGYGQPIEQYVLPFDVYGKYDTPGWPDIGKPEVEREPANLAIYVEAMKQVRKHILAMVDPEKTRLIVYLNGLDESYFPEAWDRMDYWGKMFDQYFPEIKFRVDGSYSEEAMEIIHDAIDYWCCHTIGYNMETIEKYRAMGIADWFYGPQLYERSQNGWCGSSTFMDLPLVNERAPSWTAWKYGTLTWCSWGIGSGWKSAWYNAETWKDYFRDHGTGPLSFRRYNGNAQVIYAPGIVPRVDRVCAALRLKAMRDGVEEWEMLNMLAKLDGNSERADKIVNGIIKEPYGEQSIGNLDIWDYNPENWDKAVIELGNLIEQASR